MKIEIDEFWNYLKKEGWEGYIWKISDQNGPSIFKDGNPIARIEDLPVYNRIQEANFYNKIDNISLHVKQIDSKIFAYAYDLNSYVLPYFRLSGEELLPASKRDLEGLKFRNLYKLTESAISKDVNSWIQIAQIFVGFKL